MKVSLILDLSLFFGHQRSETSGGRLFFFTYLPRNLANIKCPSTQALSCCYKNRPQSGSISSCPAWFFSTPPPFFSSSLFKCWTPLVSYACSFISSFSGSFSPRGDYNVFSQLAWVQYSLFEHLIDTHRCVYVN